MNLFGSSDSSNFIVNMKPEKLRSMISKFCTVMLILMTVSAAAALMTPMAAYLPSAILAIFGFGGVLLYIIAALKKEISVKNVGFVLIIAMAVLTGLSTISAIHRETAVYGLTGRYEGLLSLLSYLGLFLLGNAFPGEVKREKLIISLIIVTAVNAAVGILQAVPFLGFPSYYQNLLSVGRTGVYLSSGLTGSPIFLGTMLTMGLALSLSAGLYYNKKWLIASALFIITAPFTRSIVPIIGFAAVFVIMLIKEVVTAKNKKNIEMLLIFLGSAAVIYAVCFLTGLTEIADKAIAFEDSFYRCFTTGALSSRLKNFYAQVWGGSIVIAADHPLLGVGPDCIIKELIKGDRLVPNTFDKSYNEFLYIAATRGFISLAVYLVFCFFTLKKAFRAAKGGSWVSTAIMVCLTAYLIQSLFSVSVITVAPIFWLLCGLCFSSDN